MVSDTDLRTLDRCLDPDETVRWAPQPKRRLAAGSAGVWGFGIVWTVFSLFWTASATRIGGTFALFGVLFVLADLYLLARPFVRARAAARTLYVLTDRRALVATPDGGERIVRTVPLDRIRTLVLTPQPDGSGTIRFDPEALVRTSALGHAPAAVDFEHVPDVAGAAVHLRALLDPDDRRRTGGAPHSLLALPADPATDAEASGDTNAPARANLRGPACA